MTLLCEYSAESKQLTYFCKTDKALAMSRVAWRKRDSATDNDVDEMEGTSDPLDSEPEQPHTNT